MKAIGIDLAGLETNPSGFAVLTNRNFKAQIVYSDERMISLCADEEPSVVAIDAPLGLPKRGNLRDADRSLIKRGLRVFPPTFAGMRKLTERGIILAKKLRARKIKVIEIHPRTSGLLLFNTSDRARWLAELKKMGLRFEGGKSAHEVDAMMAAMTGLLYLKGEAEKVGTQREGTIVIPIA